MRKTRKQLKQMVKLYQSDNGALANEAIKHKELAERATADCLRLIRRLDEYKARAEKAEAEVICFRSEISSLEGMIESLIEAGNYYANYGSIRKWVEATKLWGKAKERQL